MKEQQEIKVERIKFYKNFKCFDIGIFIDWEPISPINMSIGLGFWRIEIKI